MTRQRLPDRRLAETFELEVAGLRYTCTVGRFPDGSIAELFLSNHKTNSAADINARDSAIVFSVAVQCGADPEVIRRALSRNSQGHASGPLGTALDHLAPAKADPLGPPQPTLALDIAAEQEGTGSAHKISHSVTRDSPDGQPWPPSDSSVLWVIVRRAEGYTLWRAIQLEISALQRGDRQAL